MKNWVFDILTNNNIANNEERLYLDYPDPAKKSKEKFNLMMYKTYDIQDLKKYVKNMKESEWFRNQSRQRETIHHTQTQTIFLSFFDLEGFDISTYEFRFLNSADEKLKNLLKPIIDDIEKECDGVIGRMMLTRMPKGSEITLHIDRNEYFSFSRRFHIPIITNKFVEFTVKNETVNMEEGTCWEINNKKMHGVKNNGEEDRVHLLFDIVPNKYRMENK